MAEHVPLAMPSPVMPSALMPSPAPPPPTLMPLSYAPLSADAYHSARPQARRLVRVLCAAVVMELVMLWPTVGTVIERWSASSEGRVFNMRLIGAAAWTQQALNFLYILALVFWATWVRRTYRNLTPLGAAGLTYTPRWAVAYNFIPGVHLFRPFQVTRETWRASDLTHSGGADWQRLPQPALVGAWWVTCLCATAAFIATLTLDVDDNDRPMLLAAACCGVAVALLRATAAVMQIAIVRRVTSLQEARAGRVGIVTTDRVVD